ncbi:hypothetical protein Nepgr_006113 [Nepenthes gracilis]|uniref:GDSL esterase/lipase n=1 Tax=Nepenthes gracilis TaxID=150966 RepID=A0AAD3XH13_NEPGR|nr:hypothetical protein Nepgr_006113 [Nepenthes gracilis]
MSTIEHLSYELRYYAIHLGNILSLNFKHQSHVYRRVLDPIILIIAHASEKLGLPYLSAYLDSIGTSFRYGANFAISGATIQLSIIDGELISAGFNQISLTNELGQFAQFKNRTSALYRRGQSPCRRLNLPRPRDFSKALYTMDIGQNDLYFRLKTMGEDVARASVPDLVRNSSVAIETLYRLGARSFWIHNTGPIGCLPILLGNKTLKTDKIGCIESFNAVAQAFNKELKDKVSQLRTQLLDTALTYVDIYSARYYLIKNAKHFGFKDPLGYCVKNGTSCSDPSEYISWDGIHFTEAANHWVANLTFDGSHSNPPLPITKACQKHPS